MPIVDLSTIEFDSIADQETSPSWDDRSPHDQLFARAGEQFQVDPARVRAIARAESNFEAKAVSGAGAQGMMQLMPKTAEYLGVKNSFDPVQNVMGGTQYFAEMMERFDGDPIKAHAAYNAGPGNIRKAIRMFGDEWLENLHKITGKHAKETRDYIEKCEGFYNEYNLGKANEKRDKIVAEHNLIIDKDAPIAGTFSNFDEIKFDDDATAPDDYGPTWRDLHPEDIPVMATNLLGSFAGMVAGGVAGAATVVGGTVSNLAGGLYGGTEDIPGEPGSVPIEGHKQEPFDTLQAAGDTFEKIAGIPLIGLEERQVKQLHTVMTPLTWINTATQFYGDMAEKSYGPTVGGLVKTTGDIIALFGLPTLAKTFFGRMNAGFLEMERGLSVLEGKKIFQEVADSTLANPELVKKLRQLDEIAGVNKAVKKQKESMVALTEAETNTLNKVNEVRAKSGLEKIKPEVIMDQKTKRLNQKQAEASQKVEVFRKKKSLPELAKSPDELHARISVAEVNRELPGLVKHDGYWEAVGGEQFTTQKAYGDMASGQTLIVKGKVTGAKLKQAILEKAQVYKKVEKDMAAQMKEAAPESTVKQILKAINSVLPKAMKNESGMAGYDIEGISKRALAKLQEPQYRKFVSVNKLPKPKEIMRNPSTQDVAGVLKDSVSKELRAVVNPETLEVTVADSGSIMHKALAEKAGIPWDSIKNDPGKTFVITEAGQLPRRMRTLKNERGPVVAGEVVTKETLPNVLKENDYALVTAENPGNKKLSKYENAQRNEAMRTYMEKEGIEYVDTEGSYGPMPEDSFMVTDITREQAVKLAKRFDQESVITKDGMFYQDGSFRPARGIEFGEGLTENFTKVKLGGEEVKFSIDFDWGAEPIKPKKGFDLLGKLKEETGAVGRDITDIQRFAKELAAEENPIKQAEMLEKKKYVGSINMNKQDISLAAKKVQLEMMKDVGKKRVVSNQETIAEAQKLLEKWNEKPKEWIKAVERIRKGQIPTAAENTAHRILNMKNMELHKEMVQQLLDGKITAAELENFNSAIRMQATKAVDPAAEGAGRLLQSFNIEMAKYKAHEAAMNIKGGMNKRQMEAYTKVNFDDPISIKAFLRELPNPKLMDYVYEYWYNSILSGIPTHGINFLSTAVWTAFQIPHTALVASIEAPLHKMGLLKHRTRYLNEIVPMLEGYASGAKRGVGAAKDVFLKGKITQVETKWAQEVGSSLNSWQRSPHAIMRAVSPAIEVPTRGLRAMDTYFNAIAFDGEIAAYARRLSNEKGLTGEARMRFETDFRLNPTKAAVESAMKQAKYSTFMDDPGWFSGAVIKARSQAPGGRFVVPFVNTIGNLLKRGVEMTPGVGLSLIKGQTPAQVIAKQIEGLIIAYSILDKLEKGEVTGAYPKDPAGRDAWKRQGKLPFSFKWGDKYHSYRRIEPFGTPIALTAIAYEDLAKADWSETASVDIFAKLASDMKDYLLDSAYLKGVSDLFGSTYAGGKRIVNFTNNVLSSFVPYASFWRSISRSYEALTEGDVGVHEKKRPNGAWYDPYIMQLPGQPKKFPTKINVWGEDIKIEGNMFRQWLPFKSATYTKDPVELGLEKLNIHPGMPAKKIKHKGEMVTLDDDIYRNFVMAAGSRTYEYYSKLMSRPHYMAQLDRAQGNEKVYERMSKNLHDIYENYKKKYRKRAIQEQLKRNKQRKVK